MIDENDRAGLAQIVGRAEADDAAFVLGLLVDPPAGRPVERHFVAVAGEKVLAEILAHLLEKKPHAPDDRIIAQHGVLFLGDVPDELEHQHTDQEVPDHRAQPRTRSRP